MYSVYVHTYVHTNIAEVTWQSHADRVTNLPDTRSFLHCRNRRYFVYSSCRSWGLATQNRTLKSISSTLDPGEEGWKHFLHRRSQSKSVQPCTVGNTNQPNSHNTRLALIETHVLCVTVVVKVLSWYIFRSWSLWQIKWMWGGGLVVCMCVGVSVGVRGVCVGACTPWCYHFGCDCT